MAADHADIATTYRQLYIAQFEEELLAGTRKPFLVPYFFLGVWIIPTLYLAIPHKNRPWLYRARWLVLAFVVMFNLNLILNHSSFNFASAYGAGLLPAWGIIWNFALLVWTRPQWDAKRVEIRRKRKGTERDSDENANTEFLSETRETGHAPKTASEEQSSLASVTARLNGNATQEDSGKWANSTQSSGVQVNGHAPNGASRAGMRERQVDNKAMSPPTESAYTPEEEKELKKYLASLKKRHNDQEPEVDLHKLAAEQEFEYYWQEYPANSSFWTRLDWAFDIVSTMRMTGWNWSISCLPPYEPPPKIGDYQLPLSVGAHKSKQGFTRPVSYKEFFLSRLLIVIPSYLVLDFVAMRMTLDPYFIIGPPPYPLTHLHPPHLPPHLATLHPILLSAQRTALAFIGIIAALQLVWNAGQLTLAFLPPLPQLFRLRAHPWHLASLSGSFSQVLDRGLAGFWGAWWHQSFRFGFSAPTAWLQRQGYVTARGQVRAVGAALAFLQSGALHAAGSYATVPAGARWWLPPLFFALAGVGSVVQGWLARVVFGAWIRRLPRWVRRLGNLLFVTVWLWATSWTLLDDFGRCGLWLYEPVPVSVFRALGFGPVEDRRVWRYDWDFFPRWHTGRHWWESGLSV
ncbi:hypothetical protein F5B20DRAFT_577812 [Whalleya microplaca]|nr:hypothetical protein F5B20DRAFT_577812 [Whalleya microplaca]